MIEPRIPENEEERQSAVERYKILDSMPERCFDDITALMAQVCNAPISLIGLLDQERHWLKSHHGIDFNESPRSLSFCGHAIASKEDIFIVIDARTDTRFADNPLVTEHGAVSYAGVPLVDSDGFALGALCVFNNIPMVLESTQQNALKNMARQVMYLIERHLREHTLEEMSQELEVRNMDLKRFACVVTHDIKSPLTNMVELTALIEEDTAEILSDETLGYLDYLKNASVELQSYVDGLLAHYTNNDQRNSQPVSFSLQELFASLNQMIVRDDSATIIFPAIQTEISTYRAALQQVLLNLITNAIKYGTGKHTKIEVTFNQTESGYHFSVIDDGPGIAVEDHGSIFELYETTDSVARDGSTGTGIGLATVNALLNRLGGSISLQSAPGIGSTFTATLPLVSTQTKQQIAA